MWQGTNLNKRDITLDLDVGARAANWSRRLAREADVVVENFSPRVIEQFGLDYECADRAQARRDPRAHAGIRPAGTVA